MPLLGIRSLRTIIIPGIMQEFQNEDRIVAYKSGWLVSLHSIHLSPCAFTGLRHISHTNHIKEALSAVILKILCLWFWKYKRWILVWIAKLFKKSRLNGLTREKNPQVLSSFRQQNMKYDFWSNDETAEFLQCCMISYPCVYENSSFFLGSQCQAAAFCDTWHFSVGSSFVLSFLETLEKDLPEREGGSPPVWKSTNLYEDYRKMLRWIRVH